MEKRESILSHFPLAGSRLFLHSFSHAKENSFHLKMELQQHFIQKTAEVSSAIFRKEVKPRNSESFPTLVPGGHLFLKIVNTKAMTRNIFFKVIQIVSNEKIRRNELCN